jgi:hypothetical protein
MAMTSRHLPFIIILITAVLSCKADKPVVQKKPEPAVIVKPKPKLLTAEQRNELRFPSDLIAQIELAAGAEAEPFLATVVIPSENMKGEQGFEAGKLVGFSVRTKHSEDLIVTYRAQIRARGFLIFKSQKGFGSLPDIVTIIKGSNSYDILKIQGTEAPNYHLDTNTIILWLKEQQQLAPFVIIGAGPDWLEARFIKPPNSMLSFAKKMIAFAPDVLGREIQTVEKLAEKMDRMNGFFLVWD